MPKRPKVLVLELKKKVKLKDIEYKNSSLISQIGRKNTKKKSKLLLKFFVNSFTKFPPISARNVPKLPDLKISSPVGQIDCENKKKKIKLLLK